MKLTSLRLKQTDTADIAEIKTDIAETVCSRLSRETKQGFCGKQQTNKQKTATAITNAI